MSSDEKWTAEVHSALMTLDGMARTSYQQQALRTIKDALMVGSILDAEGDGGAVGSDMFDIASKVRDYLNRELPDENKHIFGEVLAALTYAQAHPSRSGEAVRVLVDWTEGNSPRFVEVERMDGTSISIPWDKEYPGNGVYSLTLHAHPARSGVVSEEDVVDAVDVFDRNYNGLGSTKSWAIRATLESYERNRK